MELARLKFVRELFSKPENWTHRAYARNASGKAVLSWDPEAVCWCLSGAIQTFNRVNSLTESLDRVNPVLLKVLEEKWPNKSSHQVNDEEGREAILEVLDEAISRLEKKGSAA